MVPVYVPCTIKLYCPGTSEIIGSRVSCGGRSKESIKISFVSDANVMDSSSTPENSILRIAYWDCTLTSSPLNTKLICLFENVGSNFKDLALPYKKKKKVRIFVVFYIIKCETAVRTYTCIKRFQTGSYSKIMDGIAISNIDNDRET